MYFLVCIGTLPGVHWLCGVHSGSFGVFSCLCIMHYGASVHWLHCLVLSLCTFVMAMCSHVRCFVHAGSFLCALRFGAWSAPVIGFAHTIPLSGTHVFIYVHSFPCSVPLVRCTVPLVHCNLSTSAPNYALVSMSLCSIVHCGMPSSA